jgi:subtilisin family serine protease
MPSLASWANSAVCSSADSGKRRSSAWRSLAPAAFAPVWTVITNGAVDGKYDSVCTVGFGAPLVLELPHPTRSTTASAINAAKSSRRTAYSVTAAGTASNCQ